ncbi:alpha/beta hydrolase [Natronolimnobius sp. AArcel1]|uniref:dienelactone hydrolase family protein n=1 Tax=Natronolimnobius sp. AArcel1 TaxID=1679093 RepID=UPI0013EA4CFD|nr:dienelactone hydrolase family protein [Natronolimnobius sp. AArcel1]NGM68223.1 alpha/beta hydrolase [Natronolimnobius sp. AArcel1]
MSNVLVPGGRDVRGTLTDPDDATALVVACPPHPQQRGSRSDSRLVAVSDALAEAGIASLRFDYGPWDDGYGECTDVQNALHWASERYDRVGLFGYSFGATLAILAAASTDYTLEAVSALAPTDKLAADLDAREALTTLECPIQVVYGERDTTVNWEPIVSHLRERTPTTDAETATVDLVPIAGDHFFVSQESTVATAVSEFFASRVGAR